MGYRYRLSRLAKKHKNKYQNLTFDELNNLMCEDEYDTFTELPEQMELLTLQTELSAAFFQKFGTEFFNKFKLNKCNGHDFYILNKEGLLEIIEYYNNEIVEILNRKIKTVEESTKDVALFDLIQRKEKWSFEVCGRKIRPYKLKTEDKKEPSYVDGSIVGDGDMEYQIFNVVFIYNTFNWEDDELILSGW